MGIKILPTVNYVLNIPFLMVTYIIVSYQEVTP